MLTVYDQDAVGPMSVIDADTYMSVYGICCRVSLRVYRLDTNFAIGMALEPAPDRERGIQCASKGMFFVPDTSSGVYREVEQRINLGALQTSVVGLVELGEFTQQPVEEVGRTILRKLESLFENARKKIRADFATTVRESGCGWMDSVYGKSCRKDYENLLKSLHWGLLFSGCPQQDQVTRTLDLLFQANIPRYFELSSQGNLEAEDLVWYKEDEPELLSRWREEEYKRREKERQELEEKKDAESRAKAEALLRRSCGEVVYQQFVAEKKIIAENAFGWKLELVYRDWGVLVFDPEGRKGHLCVHTPGMSCHPLDEMIIVYLYFMHKFEELMANSNVFNCDEGFSIAKFANAKKRRRRAR